MKKLFFIVLLAFALLVGCGPMEFVPEVYTLPPTPTPEPTEAAWADMPVIRVRAPADVQVLDPQYAASDEEISHLRLIYEGLTRFNATLDTVPGAASSWEYNTDSTEITFTLRNWLKYSDGSTLNARRFEYSLLRAVDPRVDGNYGDLLIDVVGVEELRSADFSSLTPEGIRALFSGVMIMALDNNYIPCTSYDQPDCLRLRIAFHKSLPDFHSLMALPLAYPLKEEVLAVLPASPEPISTYDPWSDKPYQTDKPEWWFDPKNLIGNGSFVMRSLYPGEYARFLPNENYWADKPKYMLLYKYVFDPDEAIALYKQDELDIVNLMDTDLTVKDDLEAQRLKFHAPCSTVLMFNHRVEPFIDQRVRQAFSMALDRLDWVKTVLKQEGYKNLSWMPKGFPASDPGETRYDFNQTRALEMLAASRYLSAQGLPEIVLYYPNDDPDPTDDMAFVSFYQPRYEWLKKSLEAIGIKVRLEGIEVTDYYARLKTEATIPMMWFATWCTSYPAADEWIYYWMPDGLGGKRSGYVSAPYTSIINLANGTTDLSMRTAYYQDAQRRLVEDNATIFLSNSARVWLVKPFLQGFTPSTLDLVFPGEIAPLAVQIKK